MKKDSSINVIVYESIYGNGSLIILIKYQIDKKHSGISERIISMQDNKVQHVFLVGAKSLGTYGGYETFVNKLTEYHQNNEKN